MRIPHVALIWFAVVAVGCECRRPTTNNIAGEVRWEWQTASGPEFDSSAAVVFPPTAMGARLEQTLFVQNVGRAAFTMEEFAQISGSPVTLGLIPTAGAAFEVRWTAGVVVNPTEKQPVTVIFAPPITENERVVDYASEVELRPSGALASRLTINGRAIAGECDVPSTIDFGSVPIGSSLNQEFTLRNDGAAAVLVTTGGVTGAPVGIFNVAGFDAGGKLTVNSGGTPNAKVNFKPTEPIDYMGEFVIRRGESCPQRTVKLKGRGVVSCLTWHGTPPDATGTGVAFGNIAPGATGPGSVTFSNACSLEITLSQLRTSDPVFAITAAGPSDLTRLVVPAATRDLNQMWVAGTAVTSLEFRPTVLGAKAGQLLGATTLNAQPGLSVNLRGFGGGPRIEVRPSPVFAIGRMGFTPGISPGTFTQRTLRVANVGNRPLPADPIANLHLGMMGQGPTYWSVRPITGTADELCVGAWDSVTNSCAGTLTNAQYDPTQGIEALATAALNLPVRVIPQTAGQKEWELTIFSNDVATPAVTVRITAEAMAVPPCNYNVAPTNLAFGIMDVPQVRDLSFTLTNLGTTPTEVCYFNGLGLSPTSADTFTIPTPSPDVMLNPGQTTTVTVRAQPLMTPPMPTNVSGEVLFNVSTPGASQGAVLLSATIAPACITIAPSPVNFLDTELECGSPDRAVVITNNCAQTVTLNSAILTNPGLAPVGSGTCTTAGGCPQFVLTSAPVAGPLAPGASRTMLLRFRPYLTGAQVGQATITMQQGAQAVPYPVTLNGNGRTRTMAGCGVSVMCPGPITVNANSTVTLTPSVMAPGATTCNWSVGSRPTTSSGTFSAPSSCTSTTYFADVVGTHLVNFSVSDGLGGTAQCTTPITVNPNGDLWIELTWDRPNDMDLHLLHPNAGSYSTSSSWGNNTWDCHFRTRTPSWGAGTQADPSLDRDDITGQGPENIRINTPSRSFAYTVGVHMYSWSAGPSAVNSTLKVYCGGQLMTTQTRSMSTNKDMWVVGRVDFNAGTPCLFTPVNSIVSNVP